MNVVLYQAPTSSASWRVRIALALKGLAWTSVWIDLRSEDHRQGPYREINPLEQVPCLEIDGLRLTQSAAIVEYLEETRPNPPLLPDAPIERARVREIAQALNSTLQPVLQRAVRGQLRHRFGATDEAVGRWVNYWTERYMPGLEQLLRRSSGRYCVGDRITAADVFLYPHMEKLATFGIDATLFECSSRIHAALGARRAFRCSHPPDSEP